MIRPIFGIKAKVFPPWSTQAHAQAILMFLHTILYYLPPQSGYSNTLAAGRMLHSSFSRPERLPPHLALILIRPSNYFFISNRSFHHTVSQNAVSCICHSVVGYGCPSQLMAIFSCYVQYDMHNFTLQYVNVGECIRLVNIPMFQFHFHCLILTSTVGSRAPVEWT